MCGCLWVHSLSLFGQAVFLVGFGLASEDLGWVLALFMVVVATELGELATAVGLLRDSRLPPSPPRRPPAPVRLFVRLLVRLLSSSPPRRAPLSPLEDFRA